MSPNYTNMGVTGKSHTMGKVWVWLYSSAARLISAGLNFLLLEICAYMLDFYLKPGCEELGLRLLTIETSDTYKGTDVINSFTKAFDFSALDLPFFIPLYFRNNSTWS